MTGKEVQIENGGFARIHNAILEILAKANLAPLEFRIVIFVIRKTYGFNKKSDVISISQFEGCGASRVGVIKAIKNLLRLKVLTRESCGQSFMYGFNKYFETWLPEVWETRYIGRGNNFHKTNKPVDNHSNEETSKPVDEITSKPVDTTSKPVDTKLVNPMVPTKDIKTIKQKTEEKTGDVLKIPENLSTDKFLKTWREWIAYRKVIKHPIQLITQNKQLKILEKHTPDIACAMLEQSMTNGWQGIFEIKSTGNNGNGAHKEQYTGPNGEVEYY